jgi:hypothetical protein
LKGSKKGEEMADKHNPNKDLKKESENEKKQKDEEHLSEEEDDHHESDKDKKAKASKEKDAKAGNNGYLNDFFFDPNNGGPKWENILLTAIMGGAFTYYLMSNSPSQEITYMDFVN